MPRRLASLLLAAVATVALGACGSKQHATQIGESEAIYVTVGGLKYQVQISRLLNPSDREDRDYMIALPPTEPLGPEEDWFAVFVRVQNESDKPLRAATDFEIRDSQRTTFRPVTFGPDNVFAYRGGVVPAGEVLPLASSAAAESTIQGSMLLFKIPFRNFDNRPLELEISSPDGSGHGQITLDV
jgi:hypothetical protein